MVRLTRSGTVSRAPNEVFAFLADCRTEEVWDPDTVSVVKLTDGPIGLDTQFRDINKAGGRQTETIWKTVVYDEPRRVTRAGESSNGMSLRSTYTVEPAGDGSRVTLQLEVELSGLRRLLEPLVRIVLARYAAASQPRLMQALEAPIEGRA